MFRMSILPLILVVGVTSSRCSSIYGNTNTFQPIVSASQSRRICAALCMTGLGGKACGDDCLDIIPTSLPAQSVNSSRVNGTSSFARTGICPVLCANNLGYPLCNCTTTDTANDKTDVDFVQICGYVCINLNYRIVGCQSCDIYKAATEMYGANSFSLATARSVKSIDWNEWCRYMCSVGDGGAACNCDILPMSLQIEK